MFKVTPFCSLDMLRTRKQTTTSGLLQAWPISTSAVITTDLPDKNLESLTGLIYVTTAKQQNGWFFMNCEFLKTFFQLVPSSFTTWINTKSFKSRETLWGTALSSF